MKVNFSNLNFRANKISLPQAQFFKKTLQNSKCVDIICHAGTDADSASCALVAASYLAQIGVKSRIIASKDISKLGVLNVEKYNIVTDEVVSDEKEKPDTVFCVDFSSKDRVPENTLKLINNADKLLCIDHHGDSNIVDHDYIHIDSPLENDSITAVSSCYVDSSAKSTTSILYRFFEALNENIDGESAYNLLLGLADDASKRGYLNCDAKSGIINPSEDAYKDKNFMEVYSALEEKLDDEQIKKIAQNVDRTANLSEDEKKLQEFLYENIVITPDNKIAYVAIEPDNELWEKAGGDTPTVSTLLNRFRQDLLNSDDEKYKDLKAAMVFYKADDNYRVSLHSKDTSLHSVYCYVENNCPAKNISIGGHATRGGGKITTVDEDSCKLWIRQVVEACEKNI